MKIQIVPGYERLDDVRVLFDEYTKMLIDGDAQFAAYLTVQRYDSELEHPEEKYAPPDGGLFLAFADDALAGCAALKKIDHDRCELKRLYVRPALRKTGIGTMLVKRIVHEARRTGYRAMLLDTLPFLEDALRMYERFGFRRTERYNNSPLKSSVFMQFDLGRHGREEQGS